eukprot:4035199-Ditylum_brightwellii.AAC.1
MDNMDGSTVLKDLRKKDSCLTKTTISTVAVCLLQNREREKRIKAKQNANSSSKMQWTLPPPAMDLH